MAVNREEFTTISIIAPIEISDRLERIANLEKRSKSKQGLVMLIEELVKLEHKYNIKTD